MRKSLALYIFFLAGNFAGCERSDLQPRMVNGWFWAGSDVRLGSRNGRVTGAWSQTGGAGEPQPDNRELRVEGKHDEACIAMLNNFYADGVVSLMQQTKAMQYLHLTGQVWHDVACYHKKWFVCEASDALLRSARLSSPTLAPRI